MHDDDNDDHRVWRGKPGTPCEHAHDPGPLKLLSTYDEAYYVQCKRCGARGVAYVTVLHEDVDESPGAWCKYDDS